MLLSSGVIWRYRSFEEFRAQCPAGDERLQRLVFERLDEGLEWLESLGAPVVARETENPLTTGVRFDTEGLTASLVRAAGDVRFEQPVTVTVTVTGDPLVLATGGFQGDAELVERYVRPAAPLRLRANPWSTGDGLRIGLGHEAALTAGLDEFYGRNMADVGFDEAGFVPLAQVYGRHARIFNERGEEFFDHDQVSWSELDLVQATAHQPGARAWYLLDDEALDQQVRYGTVRELVAVSAHADRPGRAALRAARRHRRRRPRRGRDHAHDRRPARGRPGPCPRRARRAGRRSLRRGRGRRRDLDRRLRERARLGARPRPHGRRDRAQLSGCRYAQRRMSPGSGEGATLVTYRRSSPSST